MATGRLDGVPRWTVTEPYISLDCELGEGPHFEEATRTLRFVDIVGKKLHRFHVDRGAESLESFETEDAIGVTADIEGDDEQLLVAAKFGFAMMGREGGKLRYIARAYEDTTKSERMRSNDGAIDPAGRFLAGTMTDQTLHEIENEGTLFRLEASSKAASGWTAAVVAEPVHIPNGLGWSADGRIMYRTDSPTYTIWAYDYDVSTGTAMNRRPWYVLEHTNEARASHDGSEDEVPSDILLAGSVPDGFAIDADGDIWSAVYGAGKVLRIRDENGRGVLVGSVTFPAANLTCPRFVDKDLIVTSAKGSGKHGGCVFRVHVGVEGKPVRRWRVDGL